MSHFSTILSKEHNTTSMMNIHIIICLMLVGMGMAQKGSSGDRDKRFINLGSLFGNRPTSIFGGRPTTSSIFGGRPTINRPVSTFGNSHNHGSSFGSIGNSHNHGSSFGSFGNSHNHGSSFVGSSSIGFGSSSFSNSFGSSGDCRYWCRTPQGQYYCCENSHQASGGVFGVVKP
ncbi:unnamed protein product, partial [Meganyctiphanes norvegica]